MAADRLLVPFWKRRIARLVRGREPETSSARNTPQRRRTWSDDAAESATTPEGPLPGRGKAKRSHAHGPVRGRTTQAGRAGRPQSAQDTHSTPDALLIPFWKKRITRLLLGGPAPRGRAGKPENVGPVDRAQPPTCERRCDPTGLPLSSKVRIPSFAAIGAADVALPLATSSTRTLGLQLVGGIGGAGLMAVSVVDLRNAKSADETLDAANSLAWGSQAVCYLSSAAAAPAAAMGFGLVGAFAQAVVGARRITQGVAAHDRRVALLGALDVGSGAVWFAGTALCGPIFLGTYAILMMGREIYVHDESIRKRLGSPSDAQPYELCLEPSLA